MLLEWVQKDNGQRVSKTVNATEMGRRNRAVIGKLRPALH
jgi:hypothetical protein